MAVKRLNGCLLHGWLNFRDRDTSDSHHIDLCLFQLKSGRMSAPRWPQALQINRGSMSDSLASLGQWSPLIAIEWPNNPLGMALPFQVGTSNKLSGFL